MLLSQRCEYAVRAALFLAAADRSGFVSVREISEALHIPQPFLAKTVQALTAAGLFTSMRGPTGGLALARPAERISVKDVVQAIDGDALFSACVLGLPDCGDRTPCPLHAEWAPARERVHRMFSDATLADTAAQVRAGSLRLDVGQLR